MNSVEAIVKSSETIASLFTPENASNKVPSCPEWTLLDLVIHLGDVQEAWSENIRLAKATERWNGEGQNHPALSETAVWFREQTQKLITAISAAEENSPCWTWWGEPRTARAVALHQVQEAEIHRWDAELAIGKPGVIPLEVAVDGIGEYLYVHRGEIEELDLPQIVFKSTDVDQSWFINPERELDSTITGTASDLVLLLNGRLGLKDLVAYGNLVGIQKLIAATPDIN